MLDFGGKSTVKTRVKTGFVSRLRLV